MIGPAIYNNKRGFSVCGFNDGGQHFRIFAQTREGAERIEEAAKRGDSAAVDALLLEGK